MPGWNVNPTTDIITFNDAPASGTNNIVVKEIATASLNVTDIFALGSWMPAYGYPMEVEFYADRFMAASSSSQPQTIWMSRIGDYSYFGKSTPIVDDDAINVTLNARQLNGIRDLVPLKSLIAMTSGGEWRLTGDNSNVLTPSTAGFESQTFSGTSKLPALLAETSAIFTQDKGYSFRDLSYSFEADGYAGSDLTAFASHLLKNHSIIDWCFQAVPYSAVYSVRDDGLMLTMTYNKEQRVVAHARHNTGYDEYGNDGKGIIESTCCVVEDNQSVVYAVVRRTQNGVEYRNIECMGLECSDYREWVGLDSALTYDGRNTSTTTITITSPISGNFTPADLLTITPSTNVFSGLTIPSGYDVDAYLNYDGEPVRIRLTQVVAGSPVTLKGRPSRDIPVEMRTAYQPWALAKQVITGFDHLADTSPAFAGDGFEGDCTVDSGGIAYIDTPRVLVHVGYPYTCTFESLDFTLIGGQPVGGKKKICREIDVLIKDTQTFGYQTSGSPDLPESALEYQDYRYPSYFADGVTPPLARSEIINVQVQGEWMRDPRIKIISNSAYPVTVLSITPKVEFGT